MNAIIFNENSPLLPATRQKVEKIRETIINDKLTPWRWFNFRGVDITDFYGKTICLKGMVYGGGTEVLVFFSFIRPFLEDVIVKTLGETLEICRIRGLNPEEPYIRETAMVLEGYLIHPIYDEMADIDRHLRGKGNPKGVPRTDVTERIDEVIKFLNECKNEMIQGIKEQNEQAILQLIAQGEGHTIEFKETLEYDVKTNQNNKDVLLSSLKTIAGLLNADGGTLLLGINDSGEIKGIERDLGAMKHSNNDRFEQKIRNCLKDRFNPQTIGKIHISFEKFTEGTICRVDVIANKEVIHLDGDVYVRDGNITRKLEGRDLTDWIQQRNN